MTQIGGKLIDLTLFLYSGQNEPNQEKGRAFTAEGELKSETETNPTAVIEEQRGGSKGDDENGNGF